MRWLTTIPLCLLLAIWVHAQESMTKTMAGPNGDQFRIMVAFMAAGNGDSYKLQSFILGLKCWKKGPVVKDWTLVDQL